MTAISGAMMADAASATGKRRIQRDTVAVAPCQWPTGIRYLPLAVLYVLHVLVAVCCLCPQAHAAAAAAADWGSATEKHHTSSWQYDGGRDLAPALTSLRMQRDTEVKVTIRAETARSEGNDEGSWEEPEGVSEWRAQQDGWMAAGGRRDLKVLPSRSHPFSWQQYLAAGSARYRKKVQWIPRRFRSTGEPNSDKGIVMIPTGDSNDVDNAMAGKDGNGSEGKKDWGRSTGNDGSLAGTGARSEKKASNGTSCSYGGGYCTSFGTPDSDFAISYHGGELMTGTVNVYLIYYGDWPEGSGQDLFETFITSITDSTADSLVREGGRTQGGKEEAVGTTLVEGGWERVLGF